MCRYGEVIRVSARFAVMYVATVVVSLFFASSPAVAGPYEDIWSVVARAGTENHEAITTLINQASNAETVGELDSALDQAHATLDSIFYAAATDIARIGVRNPEYDQEVLEALSQLNSDHEAAHAEANYTYQLFLDALPTTTTTTVPPTTTTTTTTVPPTTTTVAATTTTTGANTTTTTVPQTTTTGAGSTTTTIPSTTTTTAAEQTTSTTSAAVIAPIDPGPPPADSPTILDDAMAVMTAPSIWRVAAATSAGTARQGEEPDQSNGIMSATVMKTVSAVLPPALAQVTVAPFIVFEVLVATLYDSMLQMALPVLLITAVMAAFVWLENRRSSDSLPS